MRAFVWWLRSAFCKHEWRERGNHKIYWTGPDGSRLSDVPQRMFLMKECTKCGWLWRQRI